MGSGLYSQWRKIWHFQMVIHFILHKSFILLYHPLEMPVSLHRLNGAWHHSPKSLKMNTRIAKIRKNPLRYKIINNLSLNTKHYCFLINSCFSTLLESGTKHIATFFAVFLQNVNLISQFSNKVFCPLIIEMVWQISESMSSIFTADI